MRSAIIENIPEDESELVLSPVGSALSGVMADHNRRTVMMFERYIHTNECSDEGGWFAFFTPNADGDCEMMQPGLYVNGRETEEEAVRELVKMACQALKDTQHLHGF